MGKSKYTPVRSLRTFIQVLALGLFFFLTIKGDNQVWMVILLGSLGLTLLFGRFYCGWLCPIHTVMRPAEWLAKKLKLQRNDIPQILKSPLCRYLFFAVFLLVLISMREQIELNVLLIFMVLAVFITLFFPAVLWHRYLCPFGVLFSIIPSILSLIHFKISRDKCGQCGKCSRVCPGGAVENGSVKHCHEINPRHCLFCFECLIHCPRDAVKINLRRF